MNEQDPPKTALRKKMRALLSDLPPASIARASEKICQRIHDQLLFGRAQTIAIYSAHGPEVDLSSLHQLFPGKKLLYPLCQRDSALTFHHVPSKDSLTPGMLGILEPNPTIHEEIPLTEIDLFLCPGLSFGQDGTRLGHGGGYYDRALQHVSTPFFGIALNQQVCDSVPHDAHDVKMNYVLTEDGLHATKPDQG